MNTAQKLAYLKNIVRIPIGKPHHWSCQITINKTSNYEHVYSSSKWQKQDRQTDRIYTNVI